MKIATNTTKTSATPETVSGACMSGKLITKDEAKKMAEWVAKQKEKKPTLLQKIVS